jgi:hypothetical protein
MKSSRYPKPRKWTPKNPEKYVGDLNNIIARSSWEIKLLNWLDGNPSVIIYNSEGLIVPYLSPVDNKEHKYYVDFLAKMRLKDGTIKTYAIEVKPAKEMVPPRKNKNKERMITEVTTYVTNQAKWAYAKEYCESRGIVFLVLNEHDLGIA